MTKKDFYESKYPKCSHKDECNGHPLKCGDCKHKPKKDWYEYPEHPLRPYWRPEEPFIPKPNYYPHYGPLNQNLLRYQ